MKKEKYDYTAFPTFFRAHCLEASSGGLSSYSSAGYHLSIHLYDLGPYDLYEQEWQEKIEALCQILGTESRSIDIWNWFGNYLPRCMEIVPRGRMESFVRGVRRAYDNEKID